MLTDFNMDQDEEIEKQHQPEYKPFTDKHLVKAIAIVFVLMVYAVIFMKILFLE